MKLIYKEFNSSSTNKDDIIKELQKQVSNNIEDLFEYIYNDDGNIIGGKVRFYKIKENPGN